MNFLNHKGMTLVEVVVAILILGIAAIPLLKLFVTGNAFVFKARHEVVALNFAQELMEEVKSLPYNRTGMVRSGEGHSNEIVLSSYASNINSGYLLSITAGKGAGQVRKVLFFDELTKVVAVDPAWEPEKKPDNSSHYLLILNGTLMTGLVRGADACSIRLAGAENPLNDYYKGYYVTISGGTGSGQARKITGYDGSTKVAMLEKDWNTIPDDSSIYKLYRSDYLIELIETTDMLKTIRVKTFYSDKGINKEVFLTSEKLKR